MTSGTGTCQIVATKAADEAVAEANAKAKAITALEGTYNKIIASKAGRWGLASLVRLGRAYEDLSNALLNSYVPTYLTEDQKEIYRMALEDKAYPAQQKAASAYKAGLDKAFELSIYNDDTAEATRRLGVLSPDEYPGLFETIPAPRYSSQSASTASFEKDP